MIRPDLTTASPRPVAATVAEAFALGVPLTQPLLAGGSHKARVWHLRTTTGDWAIKEFTPPGDAWGMMAEDPRALAFETAARTAGVAASEPVFPVTASGVRAALTSDDGASVRQVRVHRWVPTTCRVRRPDGAMLGVNLAMLHRLGFPADPVPPWFADSLPVGWWREQADRAAVARMGWARALDRVVIAFEAVSDFVRSSASRHRAPIWCHRDLNRPNVLAGPAGQLTIIDWDDSGSWTADEELADVILRWCLDPSGDPKVETMREVTAAYVRADGPGRLSGMEPFASTLAARFHWIAENVVLLLSTPAAVEPWRRQWAEGIVEHALERPLTLDTLAAALSALHLIRSPLLVPL